MPLPPTYLENNISSFWNFTYPKYNLPWKSVLAISLGKPFLRVGNIDADKNDVEDYKDTEMLLDFKLQFKSK